MQENATRATAHLVYANQNPKSGETTETLCGQTIDVGHVRVPYTSHGPALDADPDLAQACVACQNATLRVAGGRGSVVSVTGAPV